MTQAPAGTVSLSQLDLLAGERGLLLGGTGTGKSTLGERLMGRFAARYPNGRILLLDSKPRFRPEYLPDGRSARRRYRHWGHGPFIPGSMLVEEPSQVSSVWKFGHRIAIAQCDSQRERVKLAMAAQVFFKEARASRPQLLVVDEMLDFFTTTGASLSGHPDSILQTIRAGREKGLGALLGSQRAKVIPGQALSEMTRLWLFMLDYRSDVRYLPEMGCPETIDCPDEPFEFVYWTKNPPAERRRIWGPYQLQLS